MKPYLTASILGAAITTSGCGYMSPAKDPDSLTVQVPLEQAPPRSEKAKSPAVAEKPSIESQLIASARKDLSGICAELEEGGGQCSGEVFRGISTDEADAEQMRILRNRCLAIIAECE